MNSMIELPIGYLINRPGETGCRVIGLCCAKKKTPRVSPVYHTNVFPYRQTCCECGKILVDGSQCKSPDCKVDADNGKSLDELSAHWMSNDRDHTHWPELFDGRN